MEVDAVHRSRGDELLEHVEESVQDPRVVDHVDAVHEDWEVDLLNRNKL